MLQCLTVDMEAAPFSIKNGRHLCLEGGKRNAMQKAMQREFGGKQSHPWSSIVEHPKGGAGVDSSNLHATVVCMESVNRHTVIVTTPAHYSEVWWSKKCAVSFRTLWECLCLNGMPMVDGVNFPSLFVWVYLSSHHASPHVSCAVLQSPPLHRRLLFAQPSSPVRLSASLPRLLLPGLPGVGCTPLPPPAAKGNCGTLVPQHQSTLMART
jgi:hypothetical protein